MDEETFEDDGFDYFPTRRTLVTVNKYEKKDGKHEKKGILSKFKGRNLVEEYVAGRELIEAEMSPERFTSKSNKRREEEYLDLKKREIREDIESQNIDKSFIAQANKILLKYLDIS